MLIERGSIVRYISNLKTLQNLRVQAVDSLTFLTIMIFHFNELPNIKSLECTSPGHRTDVIFPSPQRTNIESLTVECITPSLNSILLQTPKLQYLNVKVTNNKPEWSVSFLDPLPVMKNLTHLKMKIFSLSYDDLLKIMKSMPYLKDLELSGSSLGPNLDNGHQLKILFGHIKEVHLDDLECFTSVTSIEPILATFQNDIDGFWFDVTCSMKHDKVYLSAFGHADSA